MVEWQWDNKEERMKHWHASLKRKVGSDKYPTLTRIKIGRVLFGIANLPAMTAWLYPIAIPMMLPISPTLWAKGKIQDFKDWRNLR